MIKDILLHVDPTSPGAQRARVGWQLASRFDAHLIGLYVDASDEEALYVYGEMATAAIKSLRAEAIDSEQRAAEIFRQAKGQATISSEWRSVKGAAVPVIAAEARCVDLVVLGVGSHSATRLLAERVPLLSARPVLLIAEETTATPLTMKRVLVAWDGGREAARAVQDALPFLEQADAIFILSIAPEGTRENTSDHQPTGAALAQHLARHGVKAEVITRNGRSASIFGILDATMTELSIDLLVMGFYGHSRMSELILGGVTREVVSSIKIPVLGSH